MELSQDRTRNVLAYLLEHQQNNEQLALILPKITTNGLSSSKLIMKNGLENEEDFPKSRIPGKNQRRKADYKNINHPVQLKITVMNITQLKERIKQNPRLKQFILTWMVHPVKTRPRHWLRLLQPFYLKRKKGAIIYRNVRKDLVPFNPFTLGKRSVIEKLFPL